MQIKREEQLFVAGMYGFNPVELEVFIKMESNLFLFIKNIFSSFGEFLMSIGQLQFIRQLESFHSQS